MPEPETFTGTADLAVFAPNETGNLHVLTGRRSNDPYRDHLALPGGIVDKGETFHDCAVRELHEETNLLIAENTPICRVGIYDTPDRNPRGRYFSLLYTTVLDQIPATQAGDDLTETRWIPAPEAWRYSLAFDHEHMIRDAYLRLANRGALPTMPSMDPLNQGRN